jgi:Sigma-70, region 4
MADRAPGPDTRFEAREAISLAFVAALQLLPPRQRAVLVLRDVLGFRAKEVAAMLDANEEPVTGALRHARANLEARLPPPGKPATRPGSPAEQAIVEHLATAYEAGDVRALVSLLADDVVVTARLAEGKYVGPRPPSECSRRSSPGNCPTVWSPPAPTGNRRSAFTSRTRPQGSSTPTGCWLSHWPVTG